jgi:hypothetical protein
MLVCSLFFMNNYFNYIFLLDSLNSINITYYYRAIALNATNSHVFQKKKLIHFQISIILENESLIRKLQFLFQYFYSSFALSLNALQMLSSNISELVPQMQKLHWKCGLRLKDGQHWYQISREIYQKLVFELLFYIYNTVSNKAILEWNGNWDPIAIAIGIQGIQVWSVRYFAYCNIRPK